MLVSTVTWTCDQTEAQKREPHCPTFSGTDGIWTQGAAFQAWVLNHNCAMGNFYDGLELKDFLSNTHKTAQIMKENSEYIWLHKFIKLLHKSLSNMHQCKKQHM